MMNDSTYTIFYSWQSDLPNGDTSGLIGDSIDAAIKSLKDTAIVHADRDTKGEFGSPDIVETIFSKIDECDVFVADVSAVATYHPVEKAGEDEGNDKEKSRRLKATPNANVMIELGYATQVVGWENIICIMNDDYNHEGEIPFDIGLVTKYLQPQPGVCGFAGSVQAFKDYKHFVWFLVFNLQI